MPSTSNRAITPSFFTGPISVLFPDNQAKPRNPLRNYPRTHDKTTNPLQLIHPSYFRNWRQITNRSSSTAQDLEQSTHWLAWSTWFFPFELWSYCSRSTCIPARWHPSEVRLAGTTFLTRDNCRNQRQNWSKSSIPRQIQPLHLPPFPSRLFSPLLQGGRQAGFRKGILRDRRETSKMSSTRQTIPSCLSCQFYCDKLRESFALESINFTLGVQAIPF